MERVVKLLKVIISLAIMGENAERWGPEEVRRPVTWPVAFGAVLLAMALRFAVFGLLVWIFFTVKGVVAP